MKKRARNSSPSSEAGFTLIELIAYLSIAAMIGTALATGSLLINRGSAAVSGRLQRMERLEIGLRILTDDFRHIARATTIAQDGPRFVFAGAPTTVEFVRTGHSSGTDRDMELVRLRIVDESSLTGVFRQTAPLPKDSSDASAVWTDPVEVVSTPSRLRFSYRRGDPDIGQWESEWGLANEMPRQVRIDVGKGPGSADEWPPSIVTIAIDYDLRCRWVEATACTLTGAGAAPATKQ